MRRNRHWGGMRYERLYNIAAGVPLFGRYIREVSKRINAICPFEEQALHKTAVKIWLLACGMSCFIFYVFFIRSPGLYSFSLSVFYIAVALSGLIHFQERRIKRRVLKQMEKMLNDVRHFFYDTHSVTRALQESAGIAGEELQIHIEIILEVLRSENMDEAVEEYNKRSQNRFLKLFLSQCVALQEYGDTEKNGESIFVRNMAELREDILNHMLQLDRLQLEFAGLAFISLVPLLTLPIIKSTAIETLPELAGFYDGTLGRILPFVYLLGTALVYYIITELQELEATVRQHWISNTEKVQFVAKCLECWEKRHYGKTLQMKRKLSEAGEMLSPRQFICEKVLCLIGSVIAAIFILLYAKQNGGSILWYEAGIVLLVGTIAYYFPDMRIKYKKALMQMNMFSEVTQLQAIIIMQMFIPDITVLRILNTMEQFAYVFRRSIQECINEYAYSAEEALQRMKESERYEMYRRLCDKFLSVDKIGVVRAFEEIIQDREHFQKRREADTYRMIKKRSDCAKLIAFVPMALIIVSYLVLPYGIEAVRQFSMILEELNRLG